MSAITLMTDFGTGDSYVGVMKGVIAQLAPQAAVIDLTHGIPPQNVAAARFNLLSSYRYFPRGTVHVAVVDPGVGTARRAIAAHSATTGQTFVAPDNGILSGILDQLTAAVALTNPSYWLSPTPSRTFHGRDIFAPVGAHLANGVGLLAVGEAIPLDSLVCLPLPSPVKTSQGQRGCIQYIDRFGNGITNLTASGEETMVSLTVGSQSIPYHATYAAVPVGEALCLVGSHGWLEIAVNGGNAAAQLRFAVGDPVFLSQGF